MLNTGRPQVGDDFAKFRSNYLDIPNEPLYPFGYGLSYTSFEYGDPSLSDTALSRGGAITMYIDVKNTGQRAGSETVQMYIRDVYGSISRPVKELKGFEKIHLEPGESARVEFQIDEELLKFYNYDLEFVAESGEFYVFIGPNSRDVKMRKFWLE
jgi:beta-glucosidase